MWTCCKIGNETFLNDFHPLWFYLWVHPKWDVKLFSLVLLFVVDAKGETLFCHFTTLVLKKKKLPQWERRDFYEENCKMLFMTRSQNTLDTSQAEADTTPVLMRELRCFTRYFCKQFWKKVGIVKNTSSNGKMNSNMWNWKSSTMFEKYSKCRMKFF